MNIFKFKSFLKKPFMGDRYVVFVLLGIVFSLSVIPDSFAVNANLFVSAENSQFDNFMSGPQVIEVVVIESDINDTDKAKGEPDVTVNGKILRMVQAIDGNWYGYFADRNMAILADSTSQQPGVGLDFGYFCSSDVTITHTGSPLPPVDFSDTVGVAFDESLVADSNGGEADAPIGGPITADCGAVVDGSDADDLNVVREEKQINEITAADGQIGVPSDLWPFIQLYPLNPTGNVIIQYNKGGGAQTTTLTFDSVGKFARTQLDKSSYGQGDDVLAIITDLWLNIDPTDEDSWTFGTTGMGNDNYLASTNYQVFDENGRTVGVFDTNAGVNNLLTDKLKALMCEDNCVLLTTAGVQGVSPVITLDDNKDSVLTNDDGNPDPLDLDSFIGDGDIDPNNPFDWQVSDMEDASGNNFMLGNVPVTITEQGPNSGLFGTYDESYSSSIRITNDAQSETSALIDYNQDPQLICISNNCPGGGGGGLIPPDSEPIPTNNANLFVITGNHKLPTVFGSSVTTIQVIDSDIDAIDEAKGEPDVTVNGKIIRMIQGQDGNWYGYFADKTAAQEADSNDELENQDVDFGVFCHRNTHPFVFGVSFTDTDGIAIPRSFGLIGFTNGNTTFGNCYGSLINSKILNNIILDPEPINTNPNVLPGQIGLDPLAWPLIQLYQFTNEGNIAVQYNKGGAAQTTTLNYSTNDPPIIEETSENDTNGGDNQWDTRPTFGVSHEDRTNLLVENGFGFNGQYFTLTDNHHTDFELQSIEIGSTNSFSATVYADKKLKVQEFLFGIPNVGESQLAELGVEVWYDFAGNIENVVVVPQSEIIDQNTINVTHDKTKCLPTEFEQLCDTTRLSVTFLEPLENKVMAIKAIDYKKREQRTYLNEGFDISGDSLNPMKTKMIPSQLKNQGLIKVTQLSKFSPYWQSEDGRIFEMNKFGSFKETNQSFERFQDTGDARTRLHSGFDELIKYEKQRAQKIFDSSKLVSELPDSFGYSFDIKNRIDQKLEEEMKLQEKIASEILDQMDKQDRHY